jgi:hypothetical protein
VQEGEALPNGFRSYKLTGAFNTLQGVKSGLCWLLYPEQRRALFGELSILDASAGDALFKAQEDFPVAALDAPLAYLHERWQATHVWMVLDPAWPWEGVVFQASDAYARQQPADGSTFVGEQKVESWLALRQAEPGSSPQEGENIVSGGWDHEHCELCWQHIEPGAVTWRDPDGHWVCHDCYTTYVQNHSLDFIEDLSLE